MHSAMKPLLLLLLAAFILPLFSTVASQGCDLSAVQVQITNTGQKAGLDVVFEVEVRNTCSCSIASVHLTAPGFASSTTVDPKLFRVDGDSYVVNDGASIASSQAVRFSFAWDHSFAVAPASLQAQC